MTCPLKLAVDTEHPLHGASNMLRKINKNLERNNKMREASILASIPNIGYLLVEHRFCSTSPNADVDSGSSQR
jgi:hypothetical protein